MAAQKISNNELNGSFPPLVQISESRSLTWAFIFKKQGFQKRILSSFKQRKYFYGFSHSQISGHHALQLQSFSEVF